MRKEIIRRIFAIIAIFTMLVTDFAPIGTGLISYAADLNKSTNNTNIEFSAYFKNEEGEKVSEITTNVQELKMYAEITVKNEGYFNGALELTEGNFNFKNQIQSDGISKIEGNKITLNQINAGNTVEIEIGIIPINSDTIQESQLKMESKIKLAGTYMETSYKGKDIEAEKTVNLKLNARENTDIEQNSEVVTNKIYNINGANKRIVQIAVKSRITDNNYPVKTSTIKAIIPGKNKQNLEQVKIVQFNSKATNGNETVNTQEWDKTATEVQMKTENTGETISWKKGVYDEYIITYIFEEETNIAGTDLQITEETEIYNKEDKITKDIINNIGTEEIAKTIITEIKDNQGEIYKGQLYANSRTDDKRTINYNTTTKITIREKNIIDSVKVKEEKDAFTTAETGDLELNGAEEEASK